MAELPVEDMGGIYKRQDGTVVMTLEQREKMKNKTPVEKRGMLVVTTFCYRDISLLKKRIDWLAHLGVQPTHDLLLVSDYDVAASDLASVVESHKPFFRQIESRQIIDPPANSIWPQGVNTAFRKTVRILSSQYGKPLFSWNKWQGWFNYEADVTLLTSDALVKLEAIHRSGGKHFTGYLNETRLSNGNLVRHLNGVAIYPTRKDSASMHYNQNMMLDQSLPWDVAGMRENLMTFSQHIGADKFSHFFGTWDYRKDGDTIVCTQKTMDGQTSEKKWKQDAQLLHHGCKDGSLVDILMGKAIQEQPIPMAKTVEQKEVIPSAPAIRETSPAGLPVTEEVRPSSNPRRMKKRRGRRIVEKVEKYNKTVKRKSVPKPAPIPAEPSPLKLAVMADRAAGMKWKHLMAKYKLNPRILKGLLS
jgi:hypothetical protein